MLAATLRSTVLITTLIRSIHGLPLLDSLVPSSSTSTVPAGTPSTDATDHHQLASKTCPSGSSRSTFKDPFTSRKSDSWNVRSGESGVTYGNDGLTLTLDPSMSDSGGIVFESQQTWQAPLTLEITITTDDIPGIVYPFIFKNEGDGGDEIDLEIVQKTFQLPVWKDGVRLKKGQDVKQKLENGTKSPSAYAYKYTGFNPSRETVYKLDWQTDSITWTVGGEKRVAFTKTASSSNFPTGPLPIRFGVWSTDANADWAGKLDWNANPHPTMKLKDLLIKGCQ